MHSEFDGKCGFRRSAVCSRRCSVWPTQSDQLPPPLCIDTPNRMSQPTGHVPRYTTRKNVRDGLASAPASLRGTSRSASPETGSNSEARQGVAGSPKSRPVSPALLYSEVTTGLPRSPQSHGSRAVSPQPSEVPLLTSDVDFNVLNTVDDQQDANGPWSPVTRKNSRTHSVRLASPHDGSAEDSVTKFPSPSTISCAGRELSSEDWIQIARRLNTLRRKRTPLRAKWAVLRALGTALFHSIRSLVLHI
ncbi:hypothetical protein DFH06DRAFT_1121180 [Mycena polygramma]|nr:hypothetical protein DFH06DRAFT_1121180 [Mycena polygramma]